MKVQDLEVFIVGNPPPSYGGRYFQFVKITTDNGIIGWGEVYAASIGPLAMKAVIHDVFERYFLGESPENIEKIYRRVYSSGFTQRPDLTVLGAFSGLEIALWDILGKARERPVWALLGGKVQSRLRSYTYLYPDEGDDPIEFYNNADASAQKAARLVKEGFTAIKFDPAGAYTAMGGHMPSAFDLQQSAEFCAKLREAVGDRADLLFGTHGQFSNAGAIRLAQVIAPYFPLWFEEPTPPDQLGNLREVAQHSPIPIATGERLCGKVEFHSALMHGATILQPALGRAGGIWEVKKISSIAEVYNAQIAPHLYAGPIEFLANIHLAASIPNFLLLETILKGGEFHNRILKGGVHWHEGYIDVPDAPGLGFEIDEDLLRMHQYEGSRLHLEAQNEPYFHGRPSRFGGG